MILLLLLACADPSVPNVQTQQVGLELSAQVDASKVDEGEVITLSVAVAHPSEVELLPVVPPRASGMTISIISGPVQAALGSGVQDRWVYGLSAPPGSYVIYPGSVQASDGEELTADPIFVDVATQGPVSELAELAPPPEPDVTSSWSWVWTIIGGMCVLVGLGIGISRWVSHQKPLEDPIETARLRYERMLAQILDEHSKTVEMSKIVRQFIADMCNEPMVMTMSPNELQEWLLVPRPSLVQATEIAQLLLALDSFKFGRAGGGEAWWKTQEARFDRAVVAPLDPS